MEGRSSQLIGIAAAAGLIAAVSIHGLLRMRFFNLLPDPWNGLLYSTAVLVVSAWLARKRLPSLWIPFASVFTPAAIGLTVLSLDYGHTGAARRVLELRSWTPWIAGTVTWLISLTLYEAGNRDRAGFIVWSPLTRCAAVFAHALLMLNLAARLAPYPHDEVITNLATNGYYEASHMAPDIPILLRYYEHIRDLPEWPGHAAFNLPGKTLFYHLMDVLQFQPVEIVVVLSVVVASTAILVFLIGTVLWHWRVGWTAGFLWTLIPTLWLYFPLMNTVTALLAAGLVLLMLHAGRGAWWGVVGSGFLMAIGILFDPLVILVTFVPVALSLNRDRWRIGMSMWRWVIVGGIAVGLLLMLYFVTGFNVYRALQHSAKLNVEFNTHVRWPVWVYNLANGPVFLLALGSSVLCGVLCLLRRAPMMTGTFLLPLVPLVLLGFAGEVARIWFFLTPLLAVASAAGLEQRSSHESSATRTDVSRRLAVVGAFWNTFAIYQLLVLLNPTPGLQPRADPGRQPPMVYCDLAERLVKDGRLNEAEVILLRARQIAPSHPVVLSDLTDLYASQRQTKDLLAACLALAQVRPRSADAQYRLAVAWTMTGREGRARETLHRVLEINPQHAAARRALGL